ncbi:MAG: DUF58 domain-containing protein [Dyella sp.]
MSVSLPSTAAGDGRVNVSLAELIAQRARMAKVAVPQVQSRAQHSGQQSSRLYGRGMDYAESRAYQPGDDVRRMDWRLTARSGKLHTKLFQEEREGRLLIVLDTHDSMRFGTRVRFKSVQAARAAALAAWYGVRGGDRVGLLAFGEVQHLQKPQGGARGALALCGALAGWDAQRSVPRREALSAALLRGNRVLRSASQVLLISDGLSCDEAARARLLDLSQRGSVSVLIVADALERQQVPAGRYPLEQNGVQREVVLQAERQRSEFQRRLGRGPQQLGEVAQALGLRWRDIDTVVDPFDAVLDVLGKGRARR